jgi:hypothetical protein
MNYAAALYPAATPAMDAFDVAASIATRQTSRSEYLGAQLTDQFLYGSLPGIVGRSIIAPLPTPSDAQVRLMAKNSGKSEDEIRGMLRSAGAVAMTEDEWRSSSYFRDGLPFEDRMSPGAAAWRASVYDTRRYREWLIENRRAGVVDSVLGFGAALAGGAPDPVNFIPFAGPATRLAAATKFGRIGGRALIGAGEAAIGATLLQPVLAYDRSRRGEDTTFAGVTADIALSATIGSMFGAGSGAYGAFRERRALASLRAEMLAQQRLDEAVAAIVEGRPVDVSPPLQREIEELRRAYDSVRAQPLGPSDDPLVRLRPDDIEEVLVARGPVFERGGEIVIPKQGSHGLSKVIIRHGELSAKDPERQVTRDDVLALPQILRDFEPVETIGGPRESTYNRTWRVSIDGREVVYGVSRFTKIDQQDYLVTMYVADASDRNFGKLSPERPGSRPAGLRRQSDAAAEAFARPPEGQVSPAPENVGLPAGRRKTREEFLEHVKSEVRAGDERLLTRLRADLAETEKIIAEAREKGSDHRATAYGHYRQQQLDAIAEVEARLVKPEEMPEWYVDMLYERELQGVDNRVASDPAPDPEIRQAEHRLTVPDSLEARAAELGVDLKSGEFAELSEVEQLRKAGGLTEAEEAALKATEETLKRADTYAAGYDAAVSCLLKG